MDRLLARFLAVDVVLISGSGVAPRTGCTRLGLRSFLADVIRLVSLELFLSPCPPTPRLLRTELRARSRCLGGARYLIPGSTLVPTSSAMEALVRGVIVSEHSLELKTALFQRIANVRGRQLTA